MLMQHFQHLRATQSWVVHHLESSVSSGWKEVASICFERTATTTESCPFATARSSADSLHGRQQLNHFCFIAIPCHSTLTQDQRPVFVPVFRKHFHRRPCFHDGRGPYEHGAVLLRAASERLQLLRHRKLGLEGIDLCAKEVALHLAVKSAE